MISLGYGNVGIESGCGLPLNFVIVAIGISLVAHSVLKIQSSSGLVSAMFVKGSQPCRGMSAVALSTWLWSKMWG